MFTEICVEDEGIGIEAGEENEIFKLYYRGKNISNQEGFGIVPLRIKIGKNSVRVLTTHF